VGEESVESIKREPVVRLNFRALDRTFKLRLRRDVTSFVENPEVIERDGKIRPLDISHIYQGELEGEPGSYVHGSIIDGIFAGRIESRRDGTTYYIDKAEQHFAEVQPFHSIMYRERDVLDSPRKTAVEAHAQRIRRSFDGEGGGGETSGGCGLTSSEIHQWMEAVQNSAVVKPHDEKETGNVKGFEDPKEIFEDTDSHSHHNLYSQYASAHHQSEEREWERKYFHHGGERLRKKRHINTNNRLCVLFLQSDPMLWEYMTNPTTLTLASGGRPGLGYSPARAREEITYLFASHVDGIKRIYENTVFNWDKIGPYRSFTFAVLRIQINTTDDCHSDQPSNPFCKSNIDVSNFLNLNSLTNQDLYCLAYVFTYRDFTQGTLGLAWVGSSLRASGGLCERWKEYSENNKRIFKSLNTGIVTLVNYGTRVPPKVSTLTFAHEVGHNFGSPHDSGDTCVPSLSNSNHGNGNYIMFASATSGDKTNNHNFSSCSIGNMTQVLNAVLNELFGKENCFKESKEAFCGNRLTEPSEQCDCGFRLDCDNPEHPDHCCYPQEHELHCRRRNDTHMRALCSPSEGICCVGSTCQFEPESSRKMCLGERECSEASYCNGTSARCPVPRPRQNLTLCNANTQICRNGECTGSVCEKIGWSLCFIDAPTNDKSYDRGLLCYVSCLNPSTQQCISSSQSDLERSENRALLDQLIQLNLQFSGIRMPAGMPCDNYRGYCDVFQKCRAVNEDGPLARLKNLLFSDKTINEIRH